MTRIFLLMLLVPVLLISLFAGQSVSQHQKSDSESVGLKGRVRTVLYEHASLSKSGEQWKEDAREIESTENYDQQGTLTQSEGYIAGVLDKRFTYFNIDGERAMKFENFSNRGGGGPGNPGKPDPRFSFKYQYKYDAQGNRKEIREINNYNRKTAHTVNKYDAKGNLLESKKTEYRYNTKPPERVETTSYKLNDKGDTIHVTRPMYSIDYSHYNYDENGNWISRKVNMDFTYDKKTTTRLSIEYRTITYHAAP